MKYLVCIDSDGVQCKFKLGDNPVRSEIKMRSRTNRASIKFLFETLQDPRGNKDFEEIKKEIMAKISKEDDVWTGYNGYTIRKTTLKKYIEVIVDMSDRQFQSAESRGIDGAIDILLSTEKLVSPKVKSSEEVATIIQKWIKKLELENEI